MFFLISELKKKWKFSRQQSTQKRNGREKRDFARQREQRQLLSLLLTLKLLPSSLSYIYICIDNSLLTLFSSENFLCVECERKKSSKIFLFFEFFSQKSLFFSSFLLNTRTPNECEQRYTDDDDDFFEEWHHQNHLF